MSFQGDDDLNKKDRPLIFAPRTRKKAYSCRLAPEVLELIKRAAKKHDVSASEVIENCVKLILDKKHKESA